MIAKWANLSHRPPRGISYPDPVNGGPSSYFKPPEPDENRYGFRKVKRGEGRAHVWGAAGNQTSDFRMKVLGIIFGAISLGVPLSMLGGYFLAAGWTIGAFWGCLVVSHFFLMISEMVTHRELPTRKIGLLFCWGGIFLAVLVIKLLKLVW